MDVDFGKTAADYARFRAGFPDAFFARLAAFGVGVAGQHVLDLGTGTGTVARGFARRGCRVTGLDRSPTLLAEARRLDREAGVDVDYVVALAEATAFRAATFDVVAAGQCWHWFDRRRAVGEARRLLERRGTLVIAHFDWIPLPGNALEATEALIVQHNAEWKGAGSVGVYPRLLRELGIAGFEGIESFSFDVAVPYTHEAWRGRVRASAGVGASMAPDRVARFDAELATLLRDRFPEEPLELPHRVFAVIGRAP